MFFFGSTQCSSIKEEKVLVIREDESVFLLLGFLTRIFGYNTYHLVNIKATWWI